MDKIEVTQADRIAAEPFFHWMIDEERVALMQAFATHRATCTDATPVAWMYSCGQIRMTYPKRADGSINGIPLSEWTEVPLYTHPPATDVAALVEALREAREALHFHYTEWDGEPEDAVPLQLARAKCDAALAPFTKGQNDE